MNKRIIISAAVFGALAVVLGAFGAHALKGVLTSYGAEIWNKAVQYQFYHTLALLFLSTFARYKNNLINFSSYCFTLGIVLFSGSLYLLALRDFLNINSFAGILGPITPIGGLLFILGWGALLFAAIRDK
ncbi:DUF423 domain-containing protein [Pseudopedobacter beijingensis]|uniref:DUF423 domain-containing protein n=1 Tax=Pseudopedobacter beijingensis TaxID=1207056 RepID=A0ABW4IHE6_9SPHI